VELGTTALDHPEEQQLWGLQDGLHVVSHTGRSMRGLLRTRRDGSRFAVTQLTDVRDDIAGSMAFRTVLPIAALIPCLLLVTALVIRDRCARWPGWPATSTQDAPMT
jgi:two-component system, OmpR family, sensor kinase